MNKKKQSPQAPAPAGVPPEEKRAFDINRNAQEITLEKKGPVPPGTVIWVNFRGIVREVGPELCVVELSELREQGRIAHPILIHVPHESIQPTQRQPRPLPPQIPD